MKIVIGNFRIEKETEKAYLIQFSWDTRDQLSRATTCHLQGLFYGAKNGEKFWIPKSAIVEFHEKYIIIHEGSLSGYDIHELEEYDAKLWKMVFEKIEKEPEKWERKRIETGHICDIHPEGYKIIYGKDVEVVIPEKVWKEICIEAKI